MLHPVYNGHIIELTKQEVSRYNKITIRIEECGGKDE
jgi:hypothetical protein